MDHYYSPTLIHHIVTWLIKHDDDLLSIRLTCCIHVTYLYILCILGSIPNHRIAIQQPPGGSSWVSQLALRQLVGTLHRFTKAQGLKLKSEVSQDHPPGPNKKRLYNMFIQILSFIVLQFDTHPTIWQFSVLCGVFVFSQSMCAILERLNHSHT